LLNETMVAHSDARSVQRCVAGGAAGDPPVGDRRAQWGIAGITQRPQRGLAAIFAIAKSTPLAYHFFYNTAQLTSNFATGMRHSLRALP
jgi:hypothetical protein